MRQRAVVRSHQDNQAAKGSGDQTRGGEGAFWGGCPYNPVWGASTVAEVEGRLADSGRASDGGRKKRRPAPPPLRANGEDLEEDQERRASRLLGFSGGVTTSIVTPQLAEAKLQHTVISLKQNSKSHRPPRMSWTRARCCTKRMERAVGGWAQCWRKEVGRSTLPFSLVRGTDPHPAVGAACTPNPWWGEESLRGRSAGRAALTFSWASAARAQAGAGQRPVTPSRWSADSHAPPRYRASWQEPRQELEELDEAEEKESPPAAFDRQGATP